MQVKELKLKTVLPSLKFLKLKRTQNPIFIQMPKNQFLFFPNCYGCKESKIKKNIHLEKLLFSRILYSIERKKRKEEIEKNSNNIKGRLSMSVLTIFFLF